MLIFSLFLNDIMNDILGIMEKSQRLALRNIVIILFYYRYTYPRTKIEVKRPHNLKLLRGLYYYCLSRNQTL